MPIQRRLVTNAMHRQSPYKSHGARNDTRPSWVSIRRLVRTWLLYTACVVVKAASAVLVLTFIVAGKRTDARALVGFVPDCVILFSRLLRDPRVPRRSKILVAALIPYLALPFDLIPDFIPVAGQADDAILVALVLQDSRQADRSRRTSRAMARSGSVALVMLRLAGV